MLYSFLLSIFSQNKENKNYYISPDGLKFENFGNISVIGTMNNSRLSNSRTSLSSSFINLCHCFKIKNYSEDEIRLLSQAKLLGEEQIFKKLKTIVDKSEESENNELKNVAIHLDLNDNNEHSILNEFLLTKFYSNSENVLYIN